MVVNAGYLVLLPLVSFIAPFFLHPISLYQIYVKKAQLSLDFFTNSIRIDLFCELMWNNAFFVRHKHDLLCQNKYMRANKKLYTTKALLIFTPLINFYILIVIHDTLVVFVGIGFFVIIIICWLFYVNFKTCIFAKFFPEGFRALFAEI